jgi:predicted TIM-barrel fold metal-dependent hydrolase
MEPNIRIAEAVGRIQVSLSRPGVDRQSQMWRLQGERMMWASDFPGSTRNPGTEPQLTLVDHLLPGPASEERAPIMGRTAARLFGW